MTRSHYFPAAAFACATILLLIAWGVVGNSFGLVLAGIALLGMVIPPLTVAVEDEKRAAIVGVSSAMVSCVACVLVVRDGSALLQLFALILSLGLLLAAVVTLQRAMRVQQHLAATIVLVAFFSWIGWPIWASSIIRERGAVPDLLIRMHPPLVANGIVPNAIPMTEMPLLYALSSLGQDVPYALPRSAWLLIGVQLVGATTAFIAARLLRRGWRTAGSLEASPHPA